MAGLRVPLSTLRCRPRDLQRMTRGRDGWLGLSRVTLAFTTPRRSPGALSVQSDLYSLGLILYEVFTGKRAFPAHAPGETRQLHESATPSKPSSHVGGLNPAVEHVIL